MTTPAGPDDPSSPGARLITLGLGLATFATAMIGYGRAMPPLSIADRAYRSLQLFVLDGAALEQIPLNEWLHVARFAAPVVTVVAILLSLPTAFLRIIRRRIALWYPGHVIVCGDTAEALALAENTHRETRTPVVLITRAPATGTRVPVVLGDPRHPATLRTAGVRLAGQVYAMTSDELTNMAIAITAAQQPTWRPLHRRTWARTRDESILPSLRLQQWARTSPTRSGIDYFSLAEAGARRLLGIHRPVGTVVVAGDGALGHEVRRLVGTAGHHVAAVELDTAAAVVGAADPRPGTTYLCPGPELVRQTIAIDLALALAQAGHTNIVLCVQRRELLAGLLTHDVGPIDVFGFLDQACRRDAVVECSVVERIARRIHQNYLDEARARNETGQSNRSAVPWAELRPHLQESNRAQAEHIGVKLVEIGAVITTSPPAEEFAFTEEEIDRLAQLEHRRWMDERIAAGYRPGPRRAGKEHPDLVDWPDLGRTAKDKDLDAVRDLPRLLAAEQLHLRRERPQ